MVGIGVKLTLEPAQIVVALADTVTEGVALLATVIVIPVLVTIVFVAQVGFVLMVHVITLPSAKVVLVYVLLVAPAIGLPLLFHW